MYFDKLMCMSTNTQSEIRKITMHQYVVGPNMLKTMMYMLLDEFDRGAISMYLDAIKARVCFQQDVSIECKLSATLFTLTLILVLRMLNSQPP